MFGLKKLFNDIIDKYRAQKAFSAAFAQLEADIQAGNVAGVEKGFETVKASSLYGVAARDALLATAIAADNVAAVVKVLDGASPHIWFQSSVFAAPNGPYIESADYILNAAISRGSRNVALYLAQHPDIDATAQDYTKTTYIGCFFVGSSDTRVRPSPLALARAAEMTYVAKVLEDRLKAPKPSNGSSPRPS